jgi:hypothetical protein
MANGQEIRALEQAYAVLEGESFTGSELVVDSG